MPTPLWLALVVAGMGIAGTLGGVVITQLRADAREDRARNIDREREGKHWDHKDRLRSFEHRREIYVAYFEAVQGMALRVMPHGMGDLLETELEPLRWAPAFDVLKKWQSARDQLEALVAETENRRSCPTSAVHPPRHREVSTPVEARKTD